MIGFVACLRILARYVVLVVVAFVFVSVSVWTDDGWDMAAIRAQPAANKASKKKKKSIRKNKKGKGSDAKPWYEGVSGDDQERAKALFDAGVAQHKQLFYSEAIIKYRQAVVYWDHPDIHYNLARAYISLGQSVDAYKSLLSAMKYGTLSLTAQDWATAQEYKTLLEGQLARIEVSCRVDGAVVTVDDEELFKGPGEKELLLVPGAHRVIARKADYLDASEWLQLNPGDRKRVELEPMSLATIAKLTVTCEESDAAVILDGAPLMGCPGSIEKVVAPDTPHVLTISRPGHITAQRSVELSPGQSLEVAMRTRTAEDMVSVRPWKPWKPWAVVGTGAVVGLLGGLLQWRAVATMDDFNREFSEFCADTGGCMAEDVPDLIGKRDTATLENRIGVSLMVVGGTVLVAGVTLALLNQPRLVPRETPSTIAITPMVSTRDAGIVVDFSF